MRISKPFILSEHVDEMFRLYAKVEGVDLDSKRIFLDERYDEIKAFSSAQWSNDNGLTSFMVLRVVAELSAARCSISALDLFNGEAGALSLTEGHRELLSMANDQAAMDLVREFQEDSMHTARIMGFEDVVSDIVNDLDRLAFVRRDALTSHRYLRVNSFRSGSEGEGVFQYNENVMVFWNIASLLAASSAQPENSISMCMIMDPVLLWSFFAFVIRDGDRITIWSDRPQSEHPLQKHMTRSKSNERRFNERAFKLRFPYQLMEFEFDDRERFIGQRESGDICPINAQAARLCKISDLPGAQALWAMMMFNLIRDDPRHTIEKSAYGMGLIAPAEYRKDRELAPYSGASLVGVSDVDMLTRNDMTEDALVSGKVFDRGTGQNRWMEERYSNQVPDDLFNLVSPDASHGICNGKECGSMKAVTLSGRRVSVSIGKGIPRSGYYRGAGLGITAIDPNLFGTVEEMESDRRWLGRFNQSKSVLRLAILEFQKRKREISDWWKERIRERTDFLADCVARGSLTGEFELIGETEKEDTRFVRGMPISGDAPLPHDLIDLPERFDTSGEIVTDQYLSTTDGPPSNEYNLGTPFYGRTALNNPYGDRNDETHIGVYGYNGEDYPHFRCFMSGQAARVWTLFTPKTALGIAMIAGVHISELPDVLQVWTAYDFYAGNTILDRVDPMDSLIDNPWKSQTFMVSVAISLQTYHRLRKSLGLKRNKPSTME